MIFEVINSQGCILREPSEVEGAFGESFFEVYTSNNPSATDIELCVADIKPKINCEMRRGLEGTFRLDEVERALKQMSPWKSPGPDGFGVGFYLKHWGILVRDVCEVVLEFLNGGPMVEDLNHTLIALVPKVKEPKIVMEFRPISLYNVLYKLISKVIANRVKNLLNVAISQNQSTFISDRLIIDIIVVAFELLH